MSQVAMFYRVIEWLFTNYICPRGEFGRRRSRNVIPQIHRISLFGRFTNIHHPLPHKKSKFTNYDFLFSSILPFPEFHISSVFHPILGLYTMFSECFWNYLWMRKVEFYFHSLVVVAVRVDENGKGRRGRTKKTARHVWWLHYYAQQNNKILLTK